MRIGINASFRMHGGGMVHLRHLLRAWHETGADREHQFVLFARKESLPALLIPSGARLEILPVRLGPAVAGSKLVWEQVALPALARDSGIDVLYCPGGIVPLRSTVPSVVMFQNAAPYSEAVNLSSAGAASYLSFRALGLMMRLSARAASRVVFISQHFKEHFTAAVGFSPARFDVIYHGRDTFPANCCEASDAGGAAFERPHILSVSHLYRYKNVPALIRGYGLARDVLQQQRLRLILVGKPKTAGYLRVLRRLITSLQLQDWVVLAGAVPHERIGRVLANCEFFVFQSLVENCPNTLIEALAAGLPIACSNASVMPEIAAGAAVYFDPMRPEDIARALRELALSPDLRARLRREALERSLAFPTWENVARLTLEALLKTARPRRNGAVNAAGA